MDCKNQTYIYQLSMRHIYTVYAHIKNIKMDRKSYWKDEDIHIRQIKNTYVMCITSGTLLYRLSLHTIQFQYYHSITNVLYLIAWNTVNLNPQSNVLSGE